MTSSLLNILSIIIIFQLLLLFVFLLSIRRGKRISNTLLAVFFLLLALNLADGLLTYYGFYNDHPALAHLEDGFIFLIGPLLYFYTQSMVYRDFKLAWKHALNLIPFVTFTLLFQLFYHLQPEEYQKLIEASIQKQTLPPGFYFSIVLVYVHIFTYLFLAYRQIIFYRNRIRDNFADVTRINLNWLTFMLGSVGVLVLLSLLYSFLPLATMGVMLHWALVLLVAFIFIFINAVVWKALKQPEIFSGIIEAQTKEKYAASTLTQTEKTALSSALLKVMMENKPHLDPALTLDLLAEKMDVTPKKLSQTINETYQQNFFDFINSFRIEEAKRIMHDATDPKITVLEIMYQSGFNSKSSFNTLFKKKTGKTPSEFKKQLQ